MHTLPKVSTTCYAIRYILHCGNTETLKIIYQAYFNSIMKYRIGLWGNSTAIINIFKLQKKALRIMMKINSCSSCRPVFQIFKVLMVPSHYIMSLTTFLAYDLEYFTFNYTIYNKHTRRRLHLHMP